MLKEISPALSRASLIGDPNVTPLPYFFGPAGAVAASLGVELRQSSVGTAPDIESAFAALAASPGGGVLIGLHHASQPGPDHRACRAPWDSGHFPGAGLRR